MFNQRNGNYNRGRFVVKNKEASNEDKGNNGKNMDQKREVLNNSNGDTVMNDKPPSLEKVWKVPAETVKEIHKTDSKYAVLSECDDEFMERNNVLEDDEDDIVEEVDKVTEQLVANEISGVERRVLWEELKMQKRVVGDKTWVLIGDFNVTLDPEEYSVGGS
ncbi:hypothetical protein Tco_0308832 [Tanacetum coccineum]